MRRLPDGYSISGVAAEEIPALIAIDLAASQLFAGTGMLAEEELSDHVPAEVFEAAMPLGHVFVARDRKGVPAGFVMTSLRGDTLYLDQVSVHPDHGRRGLGAALIRRVFEDAGDRGLKTVTLSTFRDLPWNAPFYRTLGFRELPRKQMTDWMLEIEARQAAVMDVTKRCFMRWKSGWL
ncbi:MAG: GNAT family N-acetyltransferase [Hyphomonas sp.]